MGTEGRAHIFHSNEGVSIDCCRIILSIGFTLLLGLVRPGNRKFASPVNLGEIKVSLLTKLVKLLQNFILTLAHVKYLRYLDEDDALITVCVLRCVDLTILS